MTDEDRASIANMQAYVATHPKRRYAQPRGRALTREQIVEAWLRGNRTLPGCALLLDLSTSTVWRHLQRLGLTVPRLRTLAAARG